MTDFVLYVIFRLFSAVMRLLPLGVWLGLSQVFAFFWYAVAGRMNMKARRHLRIAFADWQEADRLKVLWRFYQHLAQNMTEAMYLFWMSEADVRRRVRLVGDCSAMDTAGQKDRGVIFVACHSGSWELCNIACGYYFKRQRYAMLIKRQTKYPLLDGFINRVRADKGCLVLGTDELKKILRHLSSGGVLGMIADHGGQEGVEIPFLGRPAMTPVGSVRMARKTGARILLSFMRRVGWGHHEMLVEPFELLAGENPDEDQVLNLTRINRRLEEWVRQNPWEYLWTYKRWKYSSRLNILVLSDGKPGHLKQSQSLAQRICALGFETRVDVLEVVSMTPVKKILAAILTWVGGGRLLWAGLPFLTDRSTRERLAKSVYDVVISAGSSVAAVNLACSWYHGARAIALMKPSLLPLKRFACVIMPRHDRRPRGKNIVMMDGALTSVTPVSMREDFERLCQSQPGLREWSQRVASKYGFLIGGDSKYCRLSAAWMTVFTEQIQGILNDPRAVCFMTLSRRTSRSAADVVKGRFDRHPQCPVLVDPSVDNPPATVGGILYLSDVLVVSAESVSMISEAVASGKPVIAVEPEAVGSGGDKRERFLQGLVQRHMITRCRVDELRSAVRGVLGGSTQTQGREDLAQPVTDALRRVFLGDKKEGNKGE